MKEIYFGERHRQLLKDVAADKWPRVCDNCSLYQPVKLSAEEISELETIGTTFGQQQSSRRKTVRAVIGWLSGSRKGASRLS
jgi:hypothetical protein